MRPTDVLKAIAYPLTEPAVVMTLIMLWLLVSFAIWGGAMGLFVLILVIPAVFRYQMIILGARARGVTPSTLDADFFDWFGNAWTLFPASIAVLAITRSPLQSLNPIALGQLLRRCAATFWIAPVFLVLSAWLSLQAEALPMMVAILLQMFLLFAFFSLTGSLIEPFGLMADVNIPDALEPAQDEIDANVEKERTAVLNHAFGFISRGNRAGGFKHVTEWTAASPDPRVAWAWFFERMLAWENQEHALFFAQLYIHDMLGHAENIPALKVLMRCHLVSERFRPLSEDLPAIIEVAQASGNMELAAVLKRN